VCDHSGANHVQVDVDQTAVQMLVGLDGGGMIAVFPKCAMPVLALIVLLRGSARDELHALRYDISAGVFHQEMDMVDVTM
jgi:hypothetical protein